MSGDAATRTLLAAEPNIQIVVCDRAEEGMGHSLASAVAASPNDSHWIVALGDMPLIKPNTILAVVHKIEQGAAFAMPVYQGQRGHPVGIHSRFRADLHALEGDAGARSIIAGHKSDVQLVETDDSGVLVDVDTVADYQNLTR